MQILQWVESGCAGFTGEGMAQLLLAWIWQRVLGAYAQRILVHLSEVQERLGSWTRGKHDLCDWLAQQVP